MKKYLNGLTKALIVSIVFLPLGLILNLLFRSKFKKDTIHIVEDNRES